MTPSRSTSSKLVTVSLSHSVNVKLVHRKCYPLINQIINLKSILFGAALLGSLCHVSPPIACIQNINNTSQKSNAEIACKSKNQSQLSTYIRPQYLKAKINKTFKNAKLLAVKLNRFTIRIKVVMTSHRKRGQQMLAMDADWSMLADRHLLNSICFQSTVI